MRRDDDKRGPIFTRRVALLAGLQGVMITGLAARMYYLQVQQNDRYEQLAKQNRIDIEYEAPIRGLIYDRYGEILAQNIPNYQLFIVTARQSHMLETLNRLAVLIPLDNEEIENLLRLAKLRRRYTPLMVREKLDWAEVTKIEANTPDLPGILIRTNYIRSYPRKDSMAHVLGYVGKVNDKDIEKYKDPALKIPGFRIGRSGVEKSLDTTLRGTAGRRLIETNAVGQTVRVIDKQPSEAGWQLDLTVDAYLQERVHRYLERVGSASAVIMDVHTGDIVSAVSTPAYDPNSFIHGFTTEEWKQLSENKLAPFRNKTFSGMYAPGSTFKMVVTLAALKEGLSPYETIDCQGKIEVGPQTFHCWHRTGHRHTNLHNSLKWSCDIYYYELAQRVGMSKIAAMARKLGFGNRLMLDIVDERRGNIPTKQWKKKRHKQSWVTGDTLQAAIGQGYVLATPLQLAVMTSRLVNGGFAVRPHVLKQTAQGPIPSLGIPQEHLNLVLKGLDGVVNEKTGTAYKARIEEIGMEMAGKTGTTQVRRITARERERGIIKNEDLPWNLRDHALFVGFAPLDKPKYACSVVVEHGGSGSKAAAPIARDLLFAAQLRDPELQAPLGLSNQI